MHLLVPRSSPSKLMFWLSPIIAIVATLLTGLIIFLVLGKNPIQAFYAYFVQSLSSRYAWGELLVKAVPLILIAEGLAIAFKSKIINIGAEGQYLMGAIFAGGVAIYCQNLNYFWVVPLLILAGMVGGALWGALPAWLKTQFNAEETLTTLMLNYIAFFILMYLINGVWKDPLGMNFPQSILFNSATTMSPLFAGLRVTASLLICAVVVGLAWLFVKKSFVYFKLEVGGLSEPAAQYAGFSVKFKIWFSLILSGTLAGLAGACEVLGPVGQLTQTISVNYGYAAIIVAFLGRLNPIGVVFAGLLMALLYLGGESVQMQLQLPQAITGVFQGLLLFYLLAADAFVNYKYRFGSKNKVSPLKTVGA